MILAYFQKDLTNPSLIIRAFGRNTKFLGNFEKIFKRFLKKIVKMHYFSIFSKMLTNNALHFCAFWMKNAVLGNFEKILKIFDEKSIEKLNFYFIFILGNLLLK